MKKIVTLFMAAGMLLGGLSTAHAIDFKAKGQWIVSADYGQNGNFTGGNGQIGYNGSEDDFEVEQRFRFQLDAVASESLSGTLYFELGDQRWGKNGHGAALGADGTSVIEIKQAYIDWLVPQTDLKFRMGLQGMALPSFTTGSQVFNDDVAGITASYKFNDNVAVTAMWARPMNDNFTGHTAHGVNNYQQNFLDNVDLFALAIPLTFDGVKVTPWAMYGAIGPNAFRNQDNYYSVNADHAGSSNAYYRAGMYPVGGGSHHERLTGYGNGIWAGVTGDIVAFDPFRIAFDFNYGSVSYDDTSANRAGWLASLLVEYKMDWVTPGIYGWYGSGDDDDTGNGSERMPFVSVNNTNNAFSRYAFNGNPYLARESAIGYGMTGTWGVGIRAKDISFVEDLKQCLYVNLIGGTNSPHMAKELVNNYAAAANTTGLVGKDSMYLTTKDYALEVGLVNSYKIYENLEMVFEASYIAMWLDKSRTVWGRSAMNGKDDTVRDAWNFNLCYVYSF